MSIRFHKPLGWEYWRVWMADRFNWTLDYVDSLDFVDSQEIIEVLQNADTAHAQNQKKLADHRKRRR